jgi:hypothetical protein
MKIVIKVDYGVFGLSNEAVERYIELKGLKLFQHLDEGRSSSSYYTVPYEDFKKVHHNDMIKTEWEGKHEGNALFGRYTESNKLCWSGVHQIERNDPALVQVVEEMDANSTYSQLKVVEIPDDVEWDIEEYDGTEWVAEKHRTWRQND